MGDETQSITELIEEAKKDLRHDFEEVSKKKKELTNEDDEQVAPEEEEESQSSDESAEDKGIISNHTKGN